MDQSQSKSLNFKTWIYLLVSRLVRAMICRKNLSLRWSGLLCLMRETPCWGKYNKLRKSCNLVYSFWRIIFKHYSCWSMRSQSLWYGQYKWSLLYNWNRRQVQLNSLLSSYSESHLERNILISNTLR